MIKMTIKYDASEFKKEFAKRKELTKNSIRELIKQKTQIKSINDLMNQTNNNNSNKYEFE